MAIARELASELHTVYVAGPKSYKCEGLGDAIQKQKGLKRAAQRGIGDDDYKDILAGKKPKFHSAGFLKQGVKKNAAGKAEMQSWMETMSKRGPTLYDDKTYGLTRWGARERGLQDDEFVSGRSLLYGDFRI